MVACLVLGGLFCSICRGLLQERGNPRGGWRAGLVEEGDDVLGLALVGSGQLASQSLYNKIIVQDHRTGSTTYKAEHDGRRMRFC